MQAGPLSHLLFRKYPRSFIFNIDEQSDRLYRRLSPKNAKVVRPTLFNYIATREEFEKYTEELWRLMTESSFKVWIHNIYLLKDVAKAHSVSHKVVFVGFFWLTKVTGPRGPENYGQVAHGSLAEDSKASITQ